MRGPIRRAKLLRPQTGERLHLVATGKERELGRIGGANQIEPLGQYIKRLLPFDLDEIACAASTPGLAHQRLGKLGARILLHNPRRTLGTQHALVGRVVAVTLNKANLALF